MCSVGLVVKPLDLTECRGIRTTRVAQKKSFYVCAPIPQIAICITFSLPSSHTPAPSSCPLHPPPSTLKELHPW